MKSIFVIYAFLLGYVHGNRQRCPRDSIGHAVFGPDCKYLCHCKDNKEECDDATGSCVSGCADKWMGPGCQYRDILWRTEAIQLKGNNAYKAVDGKADTCSSSGTTGGPLWWKAWFEQREIIRGMTIITKEKNIGSFSWFKVYVGEYIEQENDRGFQRQEICYEHDGVPFLTTNITVTCVQPLRGNQIRIQLDSSQTELVLCDVRVFGGRNLAYSKQTSQSSTYLDRISSNAVDGTTNSKHPNNCAFTYYNPQWTVDLGKVVKVQALELISADENPFRSDDIIQGGVDYNLYPTQFHLNGNITLFFTTDSKFRYLQIKRRHGFLAICEVLVFGDCLENECGLDCNIPCHCAEFTFDYKISGECHEGCAVGWTGEGHKCDTECAPGSYGLGCLEQCKGHCGNNISCEKVRGHCPQGCAAGWMGEMCDEECSDGTYGSDCSKLCSDNCLGRRPCDKESGLCRTGCKPGWKGDTCHTVCADRKYGHECEQQCSGHCINNDGCDNVDGHCRRGCADGWIGVKCDTACAPWTFGTNCSEACGNCLNGTVCNTVNGQCPGGCRAGWSGAVCKTACSNGWYGPGCKRRCSGHCVDNDVCDKIDGHCPRGCADGWKADTCHTECEEGFYGSNCKDRCSIHCWADSYCNKTNGHCTSCIHGWTGLKCEKECPDGKYGYMCYYNCSGNCLHGRFCNKTNGYCDDECIPGWTGNTCNLTCNTWYYGYGCKERCSDHCFNNDICDNVDGNCPRGCADGWIGLKCDTGCNDGTYGTNCSRQCSGHCMYNDICNKLDGHCPRGCAAKWRGNKCDAECSKGSYGVNCRENCSLHCKDERMCDKTNGMCVGGCKAGWQGLTCLTECKNGTYGVECSGNCSGNCLDEGVCDKVDGHCSQGCAAGWEGQKCDTECHGGTYGIKCQLNCSGHCQNEAFCNRVTGVCDERCKPGWTGSLCNEECSNGTFGMDCSQNCSGHCVDGETCNKTDGYCDRGCVAGWQGNLCNIVQDFQNNWPLVGGTIVAILVLIGFVFLAAVVYRRFYIPSRWNKRPQEPVPDQPSDNTVGRLTQSNRICNDADPSRQQGAAALAKDGCEYYNMEERIAPIINMTAHGIHLANLISILENEKHRPGKLAAEFAEIPTVAKHSCLEAKKSSNKHKNRYQQMYPYDHNRVILHTVGADPSSDYINASHIDGYTLRDAYIAAQGTTKANLGDFWRLIWEKKVKVIVVLTELYEQGKLKCEQYWDSTGPVTFGDITVTVLSEEQFAEFTIRTFQATPVGNKSPLLVKQYHYTAWPDKACPDGTASLLCFWGRVYKDNPKSDTPWLVHCSAGVGRTGTFIALDILISQGRDTGYVDVYGCVEALRQQRVFMVQTKGQYIYLHELVADALVLHSLPVSTDEFLRLTSSGASAVDSAWNAVKEHMMVGGNVIRRDSTSKSGMMPENIHKNRVKSIVPDEQYRPYLLMPSDGGSNYINAVYMPSYRRKHGIILTQTPLPTTTTDWWRLVYQHKIHTVLAFDDTPTNENIGLCFPMDRKLENGQFQTKQLSFEQDRGFTISKHVLSYEGKSRELTCLHYQEWPKDNIVPFDCVTMLHFCLEVLALQNQHLDSPLLIQCFDGATRSGLMAVLLYALDRLRLEDEVAVLQILHHLRLRRPQIVPNKEQLQFCYEVIRHHLQEGSTYANL